MWTFLTWAASVVLLLGQVESCSVSISAISALFSPETGGWMIRLGWSEMNPKCDMRLDELVIEGEPFETVETQTCNSGTYCYFKSSAQACEDGKPKYTTMKFTSMCSQCSFATFTFTIGSLINGQGNSVCNRLVIDGKSILNNKSPPFEFEQCGRNETCDASGAIEAPGCYCPEGYLLNPEMMSCVKPSDQCPGKKVPDKPLNLQVPDCVTPSEPVIMKWNVDPERNYEYSITDSSGAVVRKQTLPGKSDPSQGFDVTGIIGTLTIPAGALGLDTYVVKVVDLAPDPPFSEQKSFNVQAGCKPILDLNINVTTGCDSSGNQKTDITWDVAADRSYSYQLTDSSGAVIKEGKGSGSGGGDFSVSSGKALVTTSLAPGSYKITVQDLDAGVKNFYSEYKDFSVEECKKPLPFNLQVPDCVKSVEPTISISWDVAADRMYKYKVRGGSSLFTATVSGGQSSGDFVVSGGRGTLTIKSPGEWDVATYQVNVTDLSSSIPSMTSGTFYVRKGCQPIVPLEIDASGICHNGESTAMISWKVESDRTYKYTLSQGGQTVAEATVPGSGSSNFPVENGRGKITLPAEPGDYTVTVQDLDAGVSSYYTESKDFSVADCEIAIMTAPCVIAGSEASVSFVPEPGQTYEFIIMVEDQSLSTPQVVLNGTIGGSGQSGQTMNYQLKSSDTLPVGRYVLAVREKATGGAGYGRFIITERGGIGPNVKYTADPQHNGMYVCLDPVEGKDFADGLSVKIGNAAEKSLSGEGYCFLQAYTGSESTLTISVSKNGGVASTANIRYIGP